MSSKTLIVVLVIIAVVIVIFLGVGFYMRKKVEDSIIELEKRQEELFDLPVQEEIDAVKKMHLVGQSQNIFREWNQKWTDLQSNSFADLENHIFEAEELNYAFRFVKARESIAASQAQLNIMEEEVEQIRQAMQNLAAQEEKNSTKIQDSLDLYDTLRSGITENAEEYGSTLPEIEKQLQTIETEFSQFVALNSTGDPIEAAEVLDTAEEHTIALRKITERIPGLVNEIEVEVPKAINKLEESHKEFLEQEYRLPETQDFEQVFKNLRSDLNSAADKLEQFELDGAEKQILEIDEAIDAYYAILTNERDAKTDVTKNASIIKEYLDHTKSNNKNLLLEIDHVSQSYQLNNNEMGRVRGYQEQLELLNTETDDLLEEVQDSEVPYSQLSKKVQNQMAAISDIEKNQIKISNRLANLGEQEEEARHIADEFDFRIRGYKRFVEKQNLPGLPKAYISEFFTTTERIEAVFKELDKVRVNIDVLNSSVDEATTAMGNLEEATNKLVEDAKVSEAMMQYANRYKTDPIINQTMNQAIELWENNFDYGAARGMITSALEAKEPGVAGRIAASYEQEEEI